MAVVVVRYETTATARWALLFIVRAFFNDTITVAVWTGFHVRLMGMLPHPRTYIRWCFAEPAGGAAYAKACGQSGHVSNFAQILLFEFEETGWFETPKPSAQVFRFNFKNIC